VVHLAQLVFVLVWQIEVGRQPYVVGSYFCELFRHSHPLDVADHHRHRYLLFLVRNNQCLFVVELLPGLDVVEVSFAANHDKCFVGIKLVLIAHLSNII